MVGRAFRLREYYNMFVALIQVGHDANAAPDRYAENNEDVERIPSPDTFVRLNNRLLQSGSLLPTGSNSGRRPTRITEELETAIIAQFDADPHLSTRVCAVRLGLANHQDVHDVLKLNGRHPYHFQKVQHLVGERDYENRVDFATLYLQMEDMIPDIIDITLFCDESTFTRDGMFNYKNYVTWNDTNQHLVLQRNTQFRFSINVWAGIIGNRLVSLKTSINIKTYHITVNIS